MMTEKDDKRFQKMFLAGFWGYAWGFVLTVFILKPPDFLTDVFFLFREFIFYMFRKFIPPHLSWSLNKPELIAMGFLVLGFLSGLKIFYLLRFGKKIFRLKALKLSDGSIVAGFGCFFFISFILLVKLFIMQLRSFNYIAVVLFIALLSGSIFTCVINLLDFKKKSIYFLWVIGLGAGVFLFFDVRIPSPEIVSESDKKMPVRNHGSPRAVLLGIDGVDWSIVTSLMKRGELPNLRRLMENGAHGYIRSFKPTLSPLIWTSIATGVDPSRHGITNFIVKLPGAVQSTPVTSSMIKNRLLWEILSDYGATVSVNGWYVSWPAVHVNGTIISDRFVYPDLNNTCFPESINAVTENYKIEFSLNQETLLRKWFRFKNFSKLLEDAEPWVHEALKILEDSFRKDYVILMSTLELMKKGQPDLLACYFIGTDRVQHLFYKYYYKGKNGFLSDAMFDASPEDVSKYGGIIENYMKFTDYAVGKILELTEDQSLIMVTSDHGFGPIREFSDKGYIYDPNRLFKALGLLKTIEGTDIIDKANTVVYDAGNTIFTAERFIYITRKYINLKTPEEIVELLKNLKTDNEREIFSKLEPAQKNSGKPEGTEECFLVKINSQIYGSNVIYGDRNIPVNTFISLKRNSGGHRINGFFLASGSQIRKGIKITEASVMDITPTILYALKYPVPSGLDGKVIMELFPDSFRENTPEVMVNDRSVERAVTDLESPEEMERTIERLKTLGYMK